MELIQNSKLQGKNTKKPWAPICILITLYLWGTKMEHQSFFSLFFFKLNKLNTIQIVIKNIIKSIKKYFLNLF